MNRRGMSPRLGGLAAFVLVLAAAGAGQSALGGAAQGGTIVNGTTDTVTNIDPAGNYDFGSFTLDINVFEHLLDFRNSAKLEQSLFTKRFSGGKLNTGRGT